MLRRYYRLLLLALESQSDWLLLIVDPEGITEIGSDVPLDLDAAPDLTKLTAEQFMPILAGLWAEFTGIPDASPTLTILID